MADRTIGPGASPGCQISVIVATRDRPGSLGACLRSILAIDRSDLELIVVDQSTDDTSRSLVAELADDRLIYVRRATPGKEAAQNDAAGRARGAILAFTDDDCEVAPGWLEAITSVFAADPAAAIVYGAVVAPPHDMAEVFVPTFEPPAHRRITSRWFPAHRCGIGANMAVRTSDFQALGGFETNMGPGSPYRSGGDWELAYRALHAGRVVVQAPEAEVLHHGAREYGGGGVRRLISNNYFGIGAGYGLHVRSGDLGALVQVGREAGSTLGTIAARAVRRERPLGVRRLISTAQGFATAVRRGRATDD